MSEARGEALCVIAGAGQLPLQVAQGARASGRDVFVAALKGHAAPADFPGFEVEIFGVGQLGGLTRALRGRRIREACLIGGVVRPGLQDIKPDFGLVRHLPALAGAFGKGDDGLLTGVIRILESEGLVIRSALEIAPEATGGQPGPLGARRPDNAALDAVKLGAQVLAALSPFDVGQAVIVAEGRPVAIEGAEGTDGLLRRIIDLRAGGRLTKRPGGVLVKAPKAGQDMRVDVPTIGPDTVQRAHEAALAGLAIAAGGVLIAEKARTVALADELGLFIEAI